MMEKSKVRATIALICGLTFWIPLLNLIFGAFAIYHGIKALVQIKKHPDKYGGKVYAVIGIILAGFVYALYIIGFGMCIYGSKNVCGYMGLEILS